MGINGDEEKKVMPELLLWRTAYLRFWALTAVKIYDFSIPGHRTLKVMARELPKFRVNLLSPLSTLNKK